jgi:hypothetical protein
MQIAASSIDPKAECPDWVERLELVQPKPISASCCSSATAIA